MKLPKFFERFTVRFDRPIIQTLGFIFLGMGLSAWGTQFYVKKSFSSFPDITEVPSHDLTVVLAGGRGRISQALEMLSQGRSKRLLIIGANPEATLEKVVPDSQWPVGVSRDLVEIENESMTTFENALKIRETVLRDQLKEITVVTSFYHALRTKLVLTKILPRWTIIHMVGVRTPNFRMESFWRHGLSVRIGAAEGLKYLWYWLFLPQIL